MGIASLLLGQENPFAQWTERNSNLLTGIGTSLLSDGMDFRPAQVGADLDRQAAEKLKADKLAENQANASKIWMRSNHPDIADMLDAGMPFSEGWNLAMKRMQPQQTSAIKTGMGVPVSLRNKQTGQWAPFAQTDNGQLINTLTGQPAKDAEWEYDPGMVAGTRAEQTTIGKGMGERALDTAMAGVNLQRLDAQSDNVISAIDKASGQAAWDSTGLFGQVLGGVAGTRAFDLRETAKTVKANLGFAELQAMRDASPTGGALGQVAVQELEALQSTLASINPDQSEEQLRENLTLVKELLERQKKYRRMASEAKYSQQQPPAAPTSGNVTSTGVPWSIEP